MNRPSEELLHKTLENRATAEEVASERIFARIKTALTRSRRRRILFRVAAVVIPVALVLGVALRLDRQVGGIFSDAEYGEFVVDRGRRTQCLFQDGTVAHLNSESKIHYPVKFGLFERRIRLEGEAYFEVAKDANRPFIVHTDHFATRVLGTSFDVTTAPRADGSSAVVLVEGSVAIDVANGESVTLNPSERFSMKDGSYSVYEVDPYKYISWKDGLLFFTSNTLFEVLQKVAAFYKIEITCSGEIGSRKCTGKLILFDDLDGTLDVLSDIFRIAYVRGPDGSVAVRPAPDDCADAVYR